MTGPTRPIDDSMKDERPAKDVVRSWWVAAARQRQKHPEEFGVPLYMTLPGAEAYDIRALVEAGLVRENDSGGLLDADAGLLVAFESNMMALGKLRTRVPNLRVREGRIEDFLGRTPFNFPSAKDRRLCRAAIVNLDFNGPFKVDGSGVPEPVLLAEKIARMHESVDSAPAVPWTFCLTLRAQFVGVEAALQSQVTLLGAEAATSQPLKDVVEAMIPQALTGDLDLSEVEDEVAQHFLLVAVPAQIARHVVHHGWEVQAIHLAAYGHDDPEHAAMVTFVIDLMWDLAVKSSPSDSLRRAHEALEDALKCVRADGTVISLLESPHAT